MYVACSTLGFARQPLPHALRAVSELHFNKVDLAIHETGPHLKPSEVAADVPRAAQMLKASNLTFAAFHIDFGPSASASEQMHRLAAVCRLARLVSAPILTVQAAPKGADIDAEVKRLSDWVRIAAAEGGILTVETHVDTLTADPQVAVELCRRVPGLGLTFDPSCYLLSPLRTDAPEEVFQYVRHVRLRDTRTNPPTFQVRIGQGEIEYGRIISQLERHRYDRVLTVDVRDLPDCHYAKEPEMRKLKYLLESLI